MGMNRIEMTGLRADNPMCVLVALGVIDLVTRGGDDAARLGWDADEHGFHAVLESTVGDVEDIASTLKSALKLDDVPALPDVASEINKVLPGDLRKELDEEDSRRRHLLSGLATEYPLRPGGQAAMTPLCMISFRGKRSLFKALAREDGTVTEEDLRDLLIGPWNYERGIGSLNLNPAARIQDSARMGPNASNDGTRGVPGSMPLAVRGMTLVPPLPSRGFPVRVVACHSERSREGQTRRRRESAFVWPVWSPGLTRAGVQLMMSRAWAKRPNLPNGVMAVYRSTIAPAKDGNRLTYPTRLA
jgi:hypothetical protein